MDVCVCVCVYVRACVPRLACPRGALNIKKRQPLIGQSVSHLCKHWRVSMLAIYFLIGFLHSSLPEGLQSPILSRLCKSLSQNEANTARPQRNVKKKKKKVVVEEALI